jgi:hypothetical protein
MYVMAKTTLGMCKYLTDEENKMLGKDLDPDQMIAYAKEHNINLESLKQNQNYIKYLNKTSDVAEHNKAIVLGKMAKELNIKYSDNVFSKMLNNEFSSTEKDFKDRYGYGLKKGKVLKEIKNSKEAGLSMVETMPKSLSMLYAISTPEKQKEILDVYSNVRNQMIGEFERIARPKNVGRGQLDATQTKLAIFCHTHYESRPPDGSKDRLDPHIHFHLTVPNYGEFMVNGKPKLMAIDQKQFFENQKLLSAKQNLLIVNELKKIGIKTEPINEDGMEHSFRVVGISREAELKVSSRKKAIQERFEEEQEKGNYLSSEKEVETLIKNEMQKNTRNEKFNDDVNEIHRKIKTTTAKALGSIDFQEMALKPQFKRELENDSLSQLDKINKQGSINEFEFKAQIVNRLKYTKSFSTLEELDKSVDSELARLQKENKFIKLENGEFTTHEIAMLSIGVVNNVKNLNDRDLTKNVSNTALEMRHKDFTNKFVEEFKTKTNSEINEGQKKAIDVISRQKKITYIEGDAGTGKTFTAIKYANDLYKSQNKNVIGVANQTSTAKELEEVGIKENYSVAKLMATAIDKDEKFKPSFIDSHKNNLILIEEASQISFKEMKFLTDLAIKTNSNIVLVGDIKQHSSVEYGNLRTVVENLPDDNKANIWQNMRQQNSVAKDIAESFRDKQPEKALQVMEKNNLLETFNNREQLLEKLASDYYQDTSNSKIGIASRNSDINLLNDIVRNKMSKDGLIDLSKQVIIEVKQGKENSTMGFTVGDKIVINENIKQGKSQVLQNGNRGTITDVKFKKENGKFKDVQIEVDVKGKKVWLNPQEKGQNHFQYSHFVSSHKSQGQTKDKAYNLMNASTNSNTEYVNFSRHKHEVKGYMMENDRAKYIENVKKVSTTKSIHQDKNVIKHIQTIEHLKTLTPEFRAEQKAIKELADKQAKELENERIERANERKRQAEIDVKQQNFKAFMLTDDGKKLQNHTDNINSYNVKNGIKSAPVKLDCFNYEDKQKALIKNQESFKAIQDSLVKKPKLSPTLKPPSMRI